MIWNSLPNNQFTQENKKFCYVKWLRKHVHIMLPKSITLKVNSSL